MILSLKFKSSNIFFIVAFLEGATVMAIEMLVAKMIAPLYGSSLYVWASIIGISLGALAIGYFSGGRLSAKYEERNTIFNILFAVFLIIALLPIAAPWIIYALSVFPLRPASFLASIILVAPPMLLLGMVPPLIISLLSSSVHDSGKISGKVYSTSTVGGIFSTLLLGYYVIPNYGIKVPVAIIAIVLAICVLTYFMKRGKYHLSIIGIVCMLVLLQIHFHKPPRTKTIKIKEQLEGIFGQINIIENLEKQERALVINNITQTLVNLDELSVSQMNYVHNISIFSSIRKPANLPAARLPSKQAQAVSKALLCGFGGGSTLNELTRLGFVTDAVDVDERMVGIATKYFDFNKNSCNIFIDDARHFLRKNNTIYDLIVIDILTSEVQPSHIFTIESLLHLKEMLADDGILIINFQGYIYGDEGRASRSVLKTLMQSQFKVRVYFNPEEIKKIVTDILFIASANEIDFNKIDLTQANECCQRAQFTLNNLYAPEKFDLQGAITLTDDNGTVLDIFNKKANEDWRAGFVKEYQIWTQNKLNVPLFK